MSLSDLTEKIQGKEAKIGVIGLGYVGLPVAALFAEAGFDVVGVDINRERVNTINQGICPIKGNEPGLAELIEEVVAKKQLRAEFNYDQLTDRDLVLIDVETPINEDHLPEYKALRMVVKDLGPVLKEGALVIVESTLAPRTMDDLVKPLLEESSQREANEGFFLGNCPERVMPGKLIKNLRTMSRVVGGMTPETAEVMSVLYSHIVDGELDQTDCLTAEIVKTAENAYRDVNIAFANEMALICEDLGGDVWKVRDLVNKSPGRNMLLPGAGVGGHCIPKDPWLLVANVKEENITHLIPAAREVNDGMPAHMVNLLEKSLSTKELSLSESRVFIMGYAYLKDSDDIRNSPSEKIVSILKKQGAEVIIHDPFVSQFQGEVFEKAKGCHAALVMVDHQDYLDLDLHKLSENLIYPLIIDGRKLLDQYEENFAQIEYLLIGRF